MKHDACTYDLAAAAAAIRVSARGDIGVEEAFRHLEFVFDALDITGQNRYEVFLEKIKEDDMIERLAEAAADYDDYDGLFQFLTALLDASGDTNETKDHAAGAGEVSTGIGLEDLDLNEMLKEMFGDQNRYAPIAFRNEDESEYEYKKLLDDGRLNLLGCRKKIMALPEGQRVSYIKIPDKPFEVLKKDFETAVHFRVLEEIAEKYKGAEARRIMLVVENEQTGLLACSYLLASLDLDKYFNTDRYENDRKNAGDAWEADFSWKAPVINSNEIQTEEQRNKFRGVAIPFASLSVQALGNNDDNTPWFEKHPNEFPLVVLLKRNYFVNNEELPKGLDGLSEYFDDIFVICVSGPKKPNEERADQIDFGYGMSLFMDIASDISFESGYDTYEIKEPDITSEYFRKVLTDAAAEQGCKTDESLNIDDILVGLKKFRANKWQSNLTILQLVKKAVSLKPGAKILKNEDFDFLRSSSLIFTGKYDVKAKTCTESAVEKMNREIYGLDDVKDKILETVSVLKMRQEREKAGLKPSAVNNTFVFLGPPGVGKTEMARHLTEILFENDLLPGKRFVSMNAAQLKGKYVGHTAHRIAELFDSFDAIFLDEAYSLAANDAGTMDIFSQEGLAQLCVELEVRAREKLIIFAGYGGDVNGDNNKMKEFLDANPGLASRMTFTVEFPSYSPDDEMLKIFKKIVMNEEYDLEEGWTGVAEEFFRIRAKSGSFGNGREARRLFQNAMTVQAARIYGKNPDVGTMKLITCDDLRIAADRLLDAEKQILGRQPNRIGFCF